MKQVMREDITVTGSKKIDDILVGTELNYEEGNRIVMLNLLWSVVLFLIALLV